MSRDVVKDFGADPTGQTDSWEAFDKACNQWDVIPGLHKYAGGTVLVPRGVYRLSRPLHLFRNINLVGESMDGVVLLFEGDGIITHNWKTAEADGYPRGASADSRIESMTLKGGDGHGFDMRAGCTLSNLFITEFKGNGVNIDTRDDNRNANRFYMERVRCSKNKNGFFIIGDDSNAGTLLNCDSRSNEEWGFWEQSFLGNAYIAIHVGYNKVGAINSIRHTAKNTFVNCYQEGSNETHPIVMSAGDVVVGGISFQYENIKEHIYYDENGNRKSAGRPVVINQVCSPLPIRGDGHEVTIGGDSVLAFRPSGQQMYYLRFDLNKNVLMLNHANSPSRSLTLAAQGHEQTPMTVLQMLQPKPIQPPDPQPEE